MEINESTEYIQADENKHPFTVWEFSQIDQATQSMVICGTWIFDVQPDIGKLKEGLKKLLNYYPHLSGRMKDKSGIHITNEGIPFTVEDEADLTAADACHKENPIKYFSDEIKISRIIRGTSAPMSVRITKLKDGHVLGIQCFHACMDGNSFYSFVSNWGKICRNNHFEKPVLDQSLFTVTNDLSRKQAMQYAIDSGWKKISTLSFLVKVMPKFASGIVYERTKPFHFSANALKEIKNKLNNESGGHYSTNVALCAFLTKMCMELYGHTMNSKCIQVSVVDYRSRLANIPATFTGNASATIPTSPFPGDASVNDVARTIHDTLAPMLKVPSRALEEAMRMSLNVMPHKLPIFPFDITGMYSRRPTVFYINNFSKLPIYDIDFGAGKPTTAIPHNLTDPILIWPAHPSKGGVEIYFSGILARTIKRLEEDDPWLKKLNQHC
jgi:hypothetical protein